VSGSSRQLRLKKVSRSLAAGRRKRLAIPLTRKALGPARRALARRRRVSAVVTVTATDREGNSIRRRRLVKLRR
jgi:hypothetical protein